MKKAIADKWIARLRSEDAPPQLKGALGDTNGARCCLGILCDIAVEEDIIGPPVPTGENEIVADCLRYAEGDQALLPDAVLEWSGIRSAAGVYDADDYNGLLTYTNDEGTSFEVIADIIEKHVNDL